LKQQATNEEVKNNSDIGNADQLIKKNTQKEEDALSMQKCKQ
jgi:hypothetical protein